MERSNTPYWMKIRRYAEDSGAGQGGGEPGNGDKPTGTQTQTFDEMLKGNPAFQAEFDRRMSKGLETAKGKWEQDAAACISLGAFFPFPLVFFSEYDYNRRVPVYRRD